MSVLVAVLCMQISFADAAKGGLSLNSVTLVGGGNVQDAVDIPTEPQFKVQFDKNVVNKAMWAVNSKCFSLISMDDEDVPVRVTKVDDTKDFAHRQDIFVQPVNPLRPGTAYYLKISPGLKAKNGAVLRKGISIAFKTEGEAPVEAPVEPTCEQPVEPTVEASRSDNKYEEQGVGSRES